MSDKPCETKTKILEAANVLFAKKGFSGVSIREISSDAGVNLAAVNYHFKNKNNLYAEVFNSNCSLMSEKIEKIGKTTNSTEELALQVFKVFYSDGSAIMNTFKMFLSEDIIPETNNAQSDDGDRIGPPGEHIFLEKIKQDLGDHFTNEGGRWATKMIFSLLVHFSVIMNTTVAKSNKKNKKEFHPDKMREALRHSVRAHLNYLMASEVVF